jgi:hypothetical protein
LIDSTEHPPLADDHIERLVVGLGLECVKSGSLIGHPNGRHTASGKGTVVIAAPVTQPKSSVIVAHARDDQDIRCDGFERIGTADSPAVKEDL